MENIIETLTQTFHWPLWRSYHNVWIVIKLKWKTANMKALKTLFIFPAPSYNNSSPHDCLCLGETCVVMYSMCTCIMLVYKCMNSYNISNINSWGKHFVEHSFRVVLASLINIPRRRKFCLLAGKNRQVFCELLLFYVLPGVRAKFMKYLNDFPPC